MEASGLSLRGRFGVDLLFNLASLAFMGVAGILANVLIGAVWGPSALGVFNQTFSIYILCSQISVLGFHLAALKFVGMADDARQRSEVLAACALLTAISTTCVTIVFWLSSASVGSLLASPLVAEGMRWSAFGLWLFSFNKLFMSVFNGQNRMRLYAVLQTVRALGIVATVGIAAVFGADPNRLPVSLTVAETATFLVALPFILPALKQARAREFVSRLRSMAAFGLRAAPSGMLSEINTRVDILLLGLFTTDYVVGLYSFASIPVEGVYQVLIVMRTIYAPLLAERLRHQDRRELLDMIVRGKRLVFLAMIPICALALAAFPLLIMVSQSGDFSDTWWIFAILLGGILLSSGFVPFGTILLLAGQPGWYSVYMAGIVVWNIIGGLALIPFFSAYGAAFALASSYVFAAISLTVLTRLRLHLAI
jgi:O-antigen/teichoic acid export membrane protein